MIDPTFNQPTYDAFSVYTWVLWQLDIDIDETLHFTLTLTWTDPDYSWPILQRWVEAIPPTHTSSCYGVDR